MGSLVIGKTACIAAILWVTTAMLARAQTFNSLLSFDKADGYEVATFLIQGADGNFYGTTFSGGAYDYGTVFRVTPQGDLTTLHSFCSQTSGGICTDGAYPLGGLVQGTNGDFYGTTNIGGTGIVADCGVGCGTVFEITATGKLTTLYSFCTLTNCTDGDAPFAPLMLGSSGNFYGTTYYGGANYSGIAGTIFEITPTGKLTTLYSFCSQGTGGSCTDGSGPSAGLVQATNGNFYGSTSSGGAHKYGTIFQSTPAGKLTSLYSFTEETEANAMVQGANGDLYGTTFEGGTNGEGTLFVVNAQGKLTTLYSFCSLADCTDGSTPYAPPVQGTDGNFYGTTSGGGTGSGGTLYEITATGTLTTLYSFCAQGSSCIDGHGPEDMPVQATNGTFYGTTYLGGGSSNCFAGCGTVFSLSMGFGPFVEARPNTGKVGRVIGILGSDLTGSSTVTFNGTLAEFEVISSTLIEAEVPIDATTGTIEVTTPGGTLSGNVAFQVEP
jgi:uncharacterized repeat protein (TIGR03803 family)